MKRKRVPKTDSELKKLVDSLTDQERLRLVEIIDSREIYIPISSFNGQTSCIGAVVKYLHDKKELTMTEISILLKRSLPAVSLSYKNAKKLDLSDNSINIPISIFSERKFSSSESLIAYLKKVNGYKLAKISKLLGKNYNTTKAIYRRYKEKCAQ